MCTVSIIVPTYNRAHTLFRALSSLLNQTFQDFEIIIIDDASTDHTADVVQGVADARVKYCRLDENRGASFARNMGINMAGGEYIAFQDSDDEWFPEKLARQISAFKKAGPQVGVVYSGIWRFQADGNKYCVPSKKNRGFSKEGDIHIGILSGNFIDLPAAVVRRECFDEVGLFDEDLPCWQDWELWIRISEKYHFSYIAEPLLNAYYSSDSISVNQRKLIAAWEQVLLRHRDEFSKNRRAFARNSLFVAHLECASGEMARCRQRLLRAFRSNPFNPRCAFFIFLSLLGGRAYRAAISKLYSI